MGTRVAIFVVHEYLLRAFPSHNHVGGFEFGGGAEFIWNLNYVVALSTRVAWLLLKKTTYEFQGDIKSQECLARAH